MGDIKDTFNKGVNSTYEICCLNTTVAKSSVYIFIY